MLVALSSASCRRRPSSAKAAPRSVGPYAAPTLRIPKTHPRIWWTPQRLANGKKWIEANPLQQRDDQTLELAMRYVLEKDKGACRAAIESAKKIQIDIKGVASDPARWAGEDVILTYDWCNDLLTPAERNDFLTRWNGYIEELNKKEWGGPGMEMSNYYWGYFRNTIEWALATYHENPKAPDFLTHALKDRWHQSFRPWAEASGRGGVLAEGTQYGPYVPGYATMPFTALADFGFDIWSTTPYFRDVVYYLIYGTTSARTANLVGGESAFEMFPFNDDHFWRGGASAERVELGSFMAVAADRWRGEPIGQYAARWVELVKPKIPKHVLAGLGPSPKARELWTLPLDYHAAGMDYFYLRDRWAPDLTAVHVQGGLAVPVGHHHADYGNFQIWRAGRWLSRESTEYNDEVAGWRGNGKEPVSSPFAHNSLLFAGWGPRNANYRRARPTLLRLESRQTHAFLAIDVTDGFRSSDEGRPERDDNPYAERVIREYLFVRPLETLVVFDRMLAASDREKADKLAKTFLLHAPTKPAIEKDRSLIVIGDQALRVFTVLPRNAPGARVIVEGGEGGQFRLEVDTQGAAQSYFLHVLQARSAKDPDVKVGFSQTKTGFRLDVVHPTRGLARIELDNGEQSRGGRFGFAAKGEPALAPLSDTVQSMQIGPNGPAWR